MKWGYQVGNNQDRRVGLNRTLMADDASKCSVPKHRLSEIGCDLSRPARLHH